MISLNKFIVENLTDFPHSKRSTSEWNELQANCEETLDALKGNNEYKSLSKLINTVSSI